VVHAEELEDAAPLPHERVEGGEEGARRRPPRDARADVEPRGPAPACDRDREELAVGRELVDRPAGDLLTEPEVVGEAPDGADAVGAGGDADELSDGVVGGERRPVPDVGW